MAERIGLEAVMDMADFNKGMKQYTSGIDDMTDKTEKGSGVFSKVGTVLGGIAKVGIGAAVVGFGALTTIIADSVGEAAKAQEVDAQLDAVLKATGGTAGMTKDSILALADSLSRVTPYEDDMIAATETVLLQFRNIGQDVFPQATAMALDLATRLGIDAPSAAKLLGKALEEPGEGLARLKQAGIAFTDEQEAMIQKMVESGDTAGAQKFIMDELGKSIGGAATAAGDTFSGKMTILQNTLGNVKEAIGTAFLPVLTELATKFTTFVQENGPQIEAFFQGLADWVTNKLIPGLIEVYNWLATNLPPAIQALSEFWTNTLQPALAAIWEFIVTNVVPILIEVYNWIAENLPPAIQALSDFWTGTLQPALQAVWEFIQTKVIPILQDVLAWLKEHLPPAIQALSDFWTGTLKPALEKVWEFIETKLIPILEDVLKWLKEHLPPAIEKLSDFWTNTLKPAIEKVWAFLDEHVIPIIKDLIEKHFANLKEALGKLADFWTGTLKPAIEKVWAFIQDPLIPIIKTLIETWFARLKETIETAKEIWETFREKLDRVTTFIKVDLIGGIKDLIAKFEEVVSTIRNKVIDIYNKFMAKAGELVENFSWLQGWIANIRDAFQWIIDKVERLIDWIRDLIEWLKNLADQVPTWLQGGSPPPLANWLGDIGAAVEELAKAQLPELQAQLNMGLGEMTLPRQAMTPAMAGAGQSVNVSFGDTTINSGLDAASFQAQVLQTVTRAVRGY